MSATKGVNRGAKARVLHVLTSNSDRPFNLDDLTEMVGNGHSKNAVTQSASALVKEYPGRVIRRGMGVYEWSSGTKPVVVPTSNGHAPVAELIKPQAAPESANTDILLVEVLTTKTSDDGQLLLVRETDTGQLYKMVPFDL